MKLSKRAESLQPSATLAITSKAKQLKAEGIDVIGFGAGEPDFATPGSIVNAAIKSLEAGETHYTPVGGSPALKSAICDFIKREYGLEYSAAEVTASCGAKQTLFNIFMALLDEGDEVVIPAPYWVSYPEQVALAGGVPVIAEVSEGEDFLLTPEILEATLTPKTKAVVLNSPSNPSGAMLDADRLAGIAGVLEGRDIVVISDDIYHKLVYEGEFVSILSVAPALKDRVIIVNGVSKTYAMTGWRIGFAAGPKNIISAMEKIQGQSTSNPTSFAQRGAIEALIGDQSCVAEMVDTFKKRRQLLVDSLNAIDKVTCAMPTGAFYAFPSIAAYVGAKFGETVINDSMDIAAFLLEEAKVAVVPGTPFGAPMNMRLSYATSDNNIIEGVRRIREAFGKLEF